MGQIWFWVKTQPKPKLINPKPTQTHFLPPYMKLENAWSIIPSLLPILLSKKSCLLQIGGAPPTWIPRIKDKDPYEIS